MKGAFPPNSMETRLTLAAQAARSSRPTSVEPVKLSLRTLSSPVSTLATTRESPVTTLNTPAGMPARSASSARARALKGVLLAGRTMKVQPAASAAAALRAIMALGKFHGVMAAATPMGCFKTTTCSPAFATGMTSP